MLNFVADTHGHLTDALDMRMNHPGPLGIFAQNRCKRFSAYVDDGVVKVLNVAEGFNDPAGDDNPTVSLAEKMLSDLSALGKEHDVSIVILTPHGSLRYA